MTATDWSKRLNGGDLRFDMWHEAIADLAACEAERDEAGSALNRANGATTREEQRADKAKAEFDQLTDIYLHSREQLRLATIAEASAEAEVNDLSAERDDLRRKLEEETQQREQADRSAKGWMETARLADTNAEDYRRKLADASLATAALVKAVDDFRALPSVENWLRYRDVAHETEQWNALTTALLNAKAALPVDGLAEEVVWLLGEVQVAGHNDWDGWKKRRDALFAKLGARPGKDG